ncbi:hypothetical protein DEV91_10113 [Phyllobacterium brassicacearum]|nr:hypothetical protein DEV91_10113 [Phyllobacterium brassicacearum]
MRSSLCSGDVGQHQIAIAERLDLNPFRGLRIHQEKCRPEQNSASYTKHDVLCVCAAFLFVDRNDRTLIGFELARNASAIELGIGALVVAIGCGSRPAQAEMITIPQKLPMERTREISSSEN